MITGGKLDHAPSVSILKSDTLKIKMNYMAI